MLAWRGIAPSLEALYRSHSRGGKLIATYADNDSVQDGLWSRRSVVEVIAQATTCETIWANSEAHAAAVNRKQTDVVSIAFVTGLCHYQGGAALIISAIQWLPGTTRLSGEGNRRRFGNLVQVSSLHPTLTVEKGYAEHWFAQHRVTDPVLSKLGEKTLAVNYFRTKDWDRRSADEIVTTGCVCLTADCGVSWPISTRDFRRDGDWPYYCVGIGRDGTIEEY